MDTNVLPAKTCAHKTLLILIDKTFLCYLAQAITFKSAYFYHNIVRKYIKREKIDNRNRQVRHV